MTVPPPASPAAAASPAPDPPGTPMGRRADRTQTRIAVAVAGPILFTPPVLALAERDGTVFGVPAIAVYLFSVWFIGIGVTALAARPRRR